MGRMGLLRSVKFDKGLWRQDWSSGTLDLVLVMGWAK